MPNKAQSASATHPRVIAQARQMQIICQDGGYARLDAVGSRILRIRFSASFQQTKIATAAGQVTCNILDCTVGPACCSLAVVDGALHERSRMVVRYLAGACRVPLPVDLPDESPRGSDSPGW